MKPLDMVSRRLDGRSSVLAERVRRLTGAVFLDARDAPPSTGPLQPATQSWAPVLLASAATALAFAAVSIDAAAPIPMLWWTLIALVASLVPFLVSPWIPHIFPSLAPGRPVEACALVLGLVWGMLPVLFFDVVGHNLRVLAVALVFSIASFGSLTLATRPHAAILFRALITGSLVVCAMKLGNHAGLALGFLAIFSSVADTSIILRSHRLALQRGDIEQEVKKQNDIIALLLNDFSEGSSDWLWETGADGRIAYASKGLAIGLGRPPLGLPLGDIAAAAGDGPGWHELMSAILRRKTIDSLPVQMSFARGLTWWEITARPMFAEDATFRGYRGVAHDITDVYLANQKLLEEKEAAERSSATKSQFLAVMSHELRTPLNAIVGFAELLGSAQAEYLSAETRADHLKTIRDSSQHLQNLINDILDATRIENGTMRLVEQETDAAELIEVAVKMCREAAEQSDSTIIANVIDGVELRGDMTRLKQVLINLLTNALKFSPAGGFVNVGCGRAEGGGLTISVRDEGVGIREADLKRIFEPYVQADEGMARRFGGAGLGLAIARRIATLHGGDVTIDSRFGVGTTATLVLPASRVTWPAPAESVAA